MPDGQGTPPPATGGDAGVTPPQSGTGNQGTGAPPAGGTPPPPAGNAGQGGQPVTGDPNALEGLRTAIEAERSNRRDAEKALKAAGYILRDGHWVNAEGMSELDKAQARIKELEGKAESGSIRVAAVEAATTLNFRDPALAHRLLDRSEITFEEDGTPKNIESLLRKLADAHPYLVKGQGTGQDFGGGARGQGSPGGNKPTMDDALRALARG